MASVDFSIFRERYPELFEALRRVKTMEVLKIESERHKTVLEQLDSLFEGSLPQIQEFLPRLDAQLLLSKTFSLSNDMKSFHKSREDISSLFTVYGREINVSFDSILIQSIITFYSERRRDCTQKLQTLLSNDGKFSRSLSTVELNAIYYTAGYIIHKLMRRHSKESDVVECLSEMVEGGDVDVPSDDKEFHSLVTLYQSKANRGGLVAVSDNVMTFFCLIENHAYNFGQTLMKASSSGKKVDRSKAIRDAVEDEDVAFDWACLTPTLMKESAEHLLLELISAWFDLRLHSMAAQSVESHKVAQAMPSSKKGLRKSLKRQNRSI